MYVSSPSLKSVKGRWISQNYWKHLMMMISYARSSFYPFESSSKTFPKDKNTRDDSLLDLL